MKHFYTLLVFIFCLQFGFGQSSFTKTTIFDPQNRLNDLKNVISADIDSDGDLDLISVSEGDEKVAWYKNVDGLGNFGPQQTVDDGLYDFNQVQVSDVDSDGDLDILAASDDFLFWYENLNGLGDFGPFQLIFNNLSPYNNGYFIIDRIIAFDIDNDGDEDIVYKNNYGAVWFENTNGLGDYSDPQFLLEHYLLGIWDVDGDSDFDFVTVDTWVENDGNGNYDTVHEFAVNYVSAFEDVEISDLDGDGDFDIIVSSSELGEVSWYENLDGTGTFNDKVVLYQGENLNSVSDFIQVEVADVNGDNYIDVVFNVNFSNQSVFYVLINIGNANFEEPQPVSYVLVYSGFITLADLDNNGAFDIIAKKVTQDNDDIFYLKNIDGTNNFENENLLIGEANSIKSSVFCDVDNDGDLDVVSSSVSSGFIYWFENINGEFVTHKKLSQSYIPAVKSLYVSDLDGDGYTDIAYCGDLNNNNGNGRLGWIKNNGTGEFGYAQNISTNLYFDPVYVKAFDLDNDGDNDLITSNGWYRNIDGEGSFSAVQPFGGIVADVNDDGLLEIIDGKKDEYLKIYQYNFEIELFELTFFIEGDNDDTVYWASDMDNDGDVDVLSVGNDLNNYWYNNTNGDGVFAQKELIPSSYIASIQIADLDIDGVQDLIIRNSQSFSYYNYDEELGFVMQQIIDDSDAPYFNRFDDLTSDIDLDGDLDILMSSGDLTLYRNNYNVTNIITGFVSYDINSNGCASQGLPLANLMIIKSDGLENDAVFTLDNGFYQFSEDEGLFEVELPPQLSNFFSVTPDLYQIEFNSLGNTYLADFCIEPIVSVNDLNIDILPIESPIPGFNTTYKIVYTNVGTTQLSGSVIFEYYDSKINFLNASETVASQTASTLTFDFTDLNPFETRTIDLEFNVFPPPTTNIDDILISTATINPVSGDETEEDNVFTLEQTVIGSYDPNDITVLEGDAIFIEDADKYLHYLIRFQNTGTASAININVEHVLNDKLDWSTMQLESLSHTGRVEIENETDVSFIFNNINLPDSTNDEPNSHGFIAFKIKPKSDVQVGDIISGVADIYFDFNPPIATNTVNTEIVEPLSVGEEELQNVKLFPNPAQNKLQITSNQIIDGLTIVDINGRVLNSIEISVSDYSLDVSSLSKGVYFLEIHSGELKSTKKFIKN